MLTTNTAPKIGGLDAVLFSQPDVGLPVTTPRGARVLLRPATLMELGDICVEYPLANLVFFGNGVDGIDDENLLTRALREIPGALCALVAACANRPGDELAIKGLRHVDDSEFFPLLKGAWEVTFPLGLKGKALALMGYASDLGFNLKGKEAPAAAPQAPNRKARRASKSTR